MFHSEYTLSPNHPLSIAHFPPREYNDTMSEHPHIGTALTGDHPMYLPDEHRTRHLYVVGKSGTGKSSFLEDLAVHDIETGKGITFIDPHGLSAKYLMGKVPRERLDDVIFLNMEDIEHPISFDLF